MSLRLPPHAAVLAVLSLGSATGPAAAGEIRGRLLIENKPAPGVTVKVVRFEDGFALARREAGREDLPSPLVSGTTRPDGTFALVVPIPSPDQGAVVRLSLSGGGLAPFRLSRLLDPAGEDVGDLRLGRAAALAGRVVDGSGGPMVGATVTLWAGRGRAMDDVSPVEALPQTTTTRADGSFRFEAAGAEGNRLRFEAPGFATQERIQIRSGALPKPAALTLGRLLRGKVTLSDKRTPAASALVRFEGRTATRWAFPRPVGWFMIDGAPSESGSVVADAGDEGRASASVAARVAEPVTIVLAPTAVLRGRVVEADGARPVPGVRLVARGEGTVFLARAGRDGVYQIRGLSPRRYRLEADDERFVPWSRDVVVVAGQVEDQDVPLVRGAALTGRVVGEDGAPIEGATLSLVRPGEHPVQALIRRMQSEGGQIRSARDGSFKATRLMPGENQRLDVSHDEYEERSIGGVQLLPGSTRSGVSIVLRRGLSARGIVRDEDGRPLAGVEVVLTRPLEFSSRPGRYGQTSFSFIGPGSMPRRETAADGRFEFRGLKAGNYTLTASRQGLGRAVLDPVSVAEGRSGEPFDIVLRPGVTISGVVRDRTGAPAAGWLVSARASGENGPVFGPGSLRTQEPTGDDGTFLLEGLAAGTSYDLQLLGASGLGLRRAGVTAPAEGVDLTVSSTGQVRGQVLDVESGRPVTDFEVTFVPDAQGGMRVRFAGPGARGRGMGQPQSIHAEDGAFLLEDVPPGKWTVQASAAGYQKGSAAAISVEEGGSVEGVELRLSKGAVVSGRVLDSRAGRPILDASVRAALSGAGPGMAMRMGGGPSENETTTDAEGRYAIAGLAPGNWTLTASHPDWSDATTNVEIKDAPAVADIRLGRGGSIGGSVSAAGRPVPGAQVGLTPAGEGGFGRGPFGSDQGSLTDERGRFRFDRLQPGRYSVGASLRNQSSTLVETVITGEEAQEVALTLAEGAVVHGSVTGLAEAARGGVNVSASGPDQYFASTRTAADGGFELADVPEGTIQLTARAGEYMTGTRMVSTTVTLAPGQREATAELVFEPGFRVDGHVTRSGKPVPEAMVFAAPLSAGDNRRSASGQTDESGAFVLEGLQQGEYRITAAGTRQPAPISKNLTISGDTTVELEAPPARIGGTVVESGSGRPLGDVAVQIIDDAGDGGMHFMTNGTSDSSGRFGFEDLEPKAYRLTFQKPAYQAETRRATAAEEAGELRVELRRGEGIALVAKDGVFGTPLRGLMVRVIDGANATVFTGNVTLDSEGRGEVPALRPGSYELRADSSGYAAVRVPGVSAPSPTLPLTLTPGGSLEIQVGPATQALPKPEATLTTSDGRPCLWNIFTDDGKVGLRGPVRRIENIPPGRYVLRVEAGVTREITISEGGHATVSLP